MSIGDEVDASLHQIAPQSRLVSLAARILPYLLGAVLLGLVIWWVLIRPSQLEQAGAQAKADSTLQAGAAQAGVDAVGVTRDVAEQHGAIDTQTRSNQRAILSASGADAPVDDHVFSALHDALCMRRAYQSEPDCAAMRAAGGGFGPAEPDAGGGSAEPSDGR